jgi:type I restriction enzyme S subunit
MIYNEALKKEIPLNWVVESIAENANIYQPQTISNDLFREDYEFDVYGGGGLIGKYKEYNHLESEVIISCRGNCGNFYFTTPKSWITGNAMVVSPKNHRLSKYYLFHYLSRYGVKQYLSGSVQKQLTRENLSLMNIVIPPKDILESFDSQVELIFNKIVSIRLENNKLQKLRDFLLPMLMNGQATID